MRRARLSPLDRAAKKPIQAQWVVPYLLDKHQILWNFY